ncbi:hypothetical protein EYZ11_006460 [Aspergillus tanneri]|nr:hypothetical protein EYZ11_006460 [Aspergillus tanneri]
MLRPQEVSTDDCPSPIQFETVLRIYSPLRDQDGRMIFSGMQPGSEVKAAQELYRECFQNVIYTPDWNTIYFTIHDALLADLQIPSVI